MTISMPVRRPLMSRAIAVWIMWRRELNDWNLLCGSFALVFFMNHDIFQCDAIQTQYSAKASLRAQYSIFPLCSACGGWAKRTNSIHKPPALPVRIERFYRYRGITDHWSKPEQCRRLMKGVNQRPPAEHGPGPFKGPSSYPQLCWWSLICGLIRKMVK